MIPNITIDAVVIDHELSSRQALTNKLQDHFPQVRLIECSQACPQALDLIKAETPDLIFWDVMPFQQQASDFFSWFGRLPPFEVVLTGTERQVTDQHLLALDYLDYLEKPIAHQQLLRLIARIQEKRQVQQLLKQVDTLTNMLARVLNPMVELPTMEGFDLIPVAHILYCRAQNNYTQIVLSDQRRLLVTRTLKEIERVLSPHPFVRIHKQHLIHLRYMTRYLKGDGGQVMMQDGKVLNVSRGRKDALKRACQGSK